MDCFHQTYFPYMDCFHQTLVQVMKMGFVRRTITKMTDKMATACRLHVWTLLLGHLSPNLFKNFIYELLSSNYYSCLIMGFVSLMIIKIVAKMNSLFHFRALCRALLSESGCSSFGLFLSGRFRQVLLYIPYSPFSVAHCIRPVRYFLPLGLHLIIACECRMFPE